MTSCHMKISTKKAFFKKQNTYPSVCFPACAGSAEEPAKPVSKDYGDPVCSGVSPTSRLQAAVPHWRAHVGLSDPAA